MTKPNVYMPFFWLEFWTAVSGWPDCAIVGYQRALTHYWFHLGCVGLPDDSEKLRRICQVDKADWQECMELIFDNDRFFKQDESGMWKQKRADKEWQYCIDKMKTSHERAMLGVKARRKNGSLPPLKRT